MLNNSKQMMCDLTNFSLSNMIKCGSMLRNLEAGANSLEEIATRIVLFLYESLIDGQTGNKACALVRFFKTYPYNQLDAECQDYVRKILGGDPQQPKTKCLTLLATVGERPEWNSRRTSVGHKAIPLTSEKLVLETPMIFNLIKQFGLEVTDVLAPHPNFIVDLDQKSYNVFYIPQAIGSPYVPAQKNFVIPFGITSVLGFGGMLPSGDLFAVIMFSKSYITPQTASMFQTLALSAKVAVLPFVNSAV